MEQDKLETPGKLSEEWGLELPAKKLAMIKARELGTIYQGTIIGCSHCTFLAAVNALELEGVKLISDDIRDKFFTGLMGLTGGVGNSGLGTCGAVNGASFVVSLATNITIEENARDNSNRWLAFFDVKHYIVEKFIVRWGTITCREIQIKKFGMAYDSRNPERSKQLFQMAKVKGCRNPYECTIALGAGWAAEAAWDIVHRSPGEREWLKEEIKRKQATDKNIISFW
ncbi:MAG: C-GCAxxG-C-C family (seleno)protein [Spirochaetota bacterium]